MAGRIACRRNPHHRPAGRGTGIHFAENRPGSGGTNAPRRPNPHDSICGSRCGSTFSRRWIGCMLEQHRSLVLRGECRESGGVWRRTLQAGSPATETRTIGLRAEERVYILPRIDRGLEAQMPRADQTRTKGTLRCSCVALGRLRPRSCGPMCGSTFCRRLDAKGGYRFADRYPPFHIPKF